MNIGVCNILRCIECNFPRILGLPALCSLLVVPEQAKSSVPQANNPVHVNLDGHPGCQLGRSSRFTPNLQPTWTLVQPGSPVTLATSDKDH